MTSTSDITFMSGLGVENNIRTLAEDGLFYYSRGLQGELLDGPLLVLIHGYPQSNFMWRHVIPLLPPNIPLFIPDIPGYGRSPPFPPSTAHSKTNQTLFLHRFLTTLLPSTPLIIAGHDRGARICHRWATISPSPTYPVLGTILLDIVPTLEQWRSFASAAASASAYHWPLLANPGIAVPMITAMGGDHFARSCIERWAGKSANSIARLADNNAIGVYASFFTSSTIVAATCDDYRAGAHEDIAEQEADQRDGRKVDCDVLVVYSETYLGSRYDLRKVWKEWVSGKGALDVQGVGGGVGHFMAEEAAAEVAGAVERFFRKYA